MNLFGSATPYLGGPGAIVAGLGCDPPGRRKNQVDPATATRTKIADALKAWAASCAPAWWASRSFMAWKAVQSKRSTQGVTSS
jgi:hypothetical protein